MSAVLLLSRLSSCEMAVLRQLRSFSSISRISRVEVIRLDRYTVCAVRWKSDVQKTPEKKNTGGQLQRSILEEVLDSQSTKEPPKTFGGKVAEKASNTFLYAAVAVSVGLLGAFVYFLAGEFFAEDSPQRIFNKALALVREDGRCQDMFGESIAGFGEETSRGRRRHVAHHKYEKDGHQRIRILFHLKGERDQGIAQAEMELRDGDWEWRFLYVESKRRPKTTHVLIDNR